MRQLFIHVARGSGDRALEIAADHGGKNLALLEGAEDRQDLLIAHVPNAGLDRMLGDLQALDDLKITLNPRGVITLYPPADSAADQATDVAPRSPIEILLSGLQSVGSWKGFLSYAAAGGVVVWIGLYTNTIYLLTAAMLISPFAGPAMNAALATARGDVHLLRRACTRYFSAIALSIAVACGLTFLFQVEVATHLMVQTSLLSSTAALLPLVAGAAGALNLCQSDRSSLVSGAATGMLVAASLAPPAGVVGMAAALGQWDMARAAGFVLLLQLVGINVAGAIVFRLYGVGPDGVRFKRGRAWFGVLAWVASLAALCALLFLQFRDTPELQQSSQEQRATAEVRQAIQDSGSARYVEADVRFTRAPIPGQDTMVVEVIVQAPPGSATDAIEQQLQARVASRLASEFEVQPLVQITAIAPAASSPSDGSP